MARLKQWLLGLRKEAASGMAQGDDLETDLPIGPAEALIALGNTLEDAGEVESALVHYREASSIAPRFARAYMNIGNALQKLGDLDRAVAAQEMAIQLAPDHPGAHLNLGALLASKNDAIAAERELREALRLRPDMTDAAIVLAEVLERAGHPDEAEAQLRNALEQDRQSAGAAKNLGLLMLKQERLDEAEVVILTAKSLNPDFVPLDGVLGSVYAKTGRLHEAEHAFRRALASQEYLRDTASALLFSLNLRDDLDAESIFREHQQLGEAFDTSGSCASAAFANPPDADRPLKIGYVSGDLRQHPVGLFVRPVFERHDRRQFDVHCFANHVFDDDMTRLLKRTALHWHPIAGVADADVADRIRSIGIDILVDLSGHTADSRLAMFSRRPAPVQVTWLGYLNTTGLRALDYRLCDWHTDPAEFANERYTEQLVRLPDSQWCYEPVYEVTPIDEPHPANRDALVFGSFNQYSKISDTCIARWCEVLTRLPAAELRVFGVPTGKTRDALLERLGSNGVDRARVSVHGRIGIREYFGEIGDVDIALDTYPYNGATTTLDTLWMGVPIVALRGPRPIARGSYSILHSLGERELIAMSPDEYIDMNVRLAQQASWRRELRASLRTRLESSPLMDSAAFAKNVEAAYRQMWRTWCQTQAGVEPAG